MDKLQELVKEGKLSENLMKDKEFVEGAKEIFKSENVEIDEEKLKQLIKEIESKLKTSEIISDEGLENISGGVTKYTKRVLVKVASTVLGSALGLSAGVAVGTGIGAAMGAGLGAAVEVDNEQKEKKLKDKEKKLKDIVRVSGSMGGLAAGETIGMASGAILGYKLGNSICRSLDLE